MGTITWREFAESKGYKSLKELGTLSREAYFSLQNDFLILTVPEIEWLVRSKHVRKTPEKKWSCIHCDVAPKDILQTFRHHYVTVHADLFGEYYKEKERERDNRLS